MPGILAAICVLVALPACSGSKPEQASTPAPAPQTPLAQLPALDTNAVVEHTRVLSSDEFEGRAPGTKGEELTVNYLVEQFKKVGLKLGNTDGTYVQKVPLVGITPDPKTSLVFKKGAQQRKLTFKDDVVGWTKHVAEVASLDNSEMVFVGYGVVAPEYQVRLERRQRDVDDGAIDERQARSENRRRERPPARADESRALRDVGCTLMPTQGA